MRRITLIISTLLLVSPVSAADPPGKNKAELGYAAYLGSWQTDAGTGIGLGGSFDQRFRPHLIGSAEMSLSALDYDLPVDLGPFVDNQVSVSTLSVGYLIKGALPTKHVELFAGVGPVLAFSRATVSSTVLFLFSGTVAEEEDQSFGFQRVAGLDFRIGKRWRLGLEYRRVELNVDFGELSDGSFNVGGDAFLVVYRRSVRR